jgi:hypothetical protein
MKPKEWGMPNCSIDTKCMPGVSLVNETDMLLAMPARQTREPIVLLFICMATAATNKNIMSKEQRYH